MGAAMRRSHRGNVWGGVALLCFLAHLWVPHPKTQRRGLGAAQGEQWGQRGGFGPQQRGRERGMLHMTAALSWWHEIHAQSCKQAKNSSVLSSFQDLNLCHLRRKAVTRDCCD